MLTKENILTIPNLLSLLRICMIPLIVWLYRVRHSYYLAAGVICLSALTDILDGYIARHFHMVSDFGKVFDPVADKLTQAALFWCLTSRYRLVWALLGLLAVKELLQLLYGFLALRRTEKVIGAQWYGKLSTVTLYSVVLLLICVPHMPREIVQTLLLICAGIMVLALLGYSRFYARQLLSKKEKKEEG